MTRSLLRFHFFLFKKKFPTDGWRCGEPVFQLHFKARVCWTAVFIIGNIITTSLLSPLPPPLNSLETCLSWNGNHLSPPSPLIITYTKLITTENNFFSKIHLLRGKIFFRLRDWRTFDLSVGWHWVYWLGSGWDPGGYFQFWY